MKLQKTYSIPEGWKPEALQTFANHYLECAEWADKEEGTSPRFPAGQKRVALALCAEFARAAPYLIELALSLPGYELEQLGHDLWLTRCGHGSGFWDRYELETEIGRPVSWVDRDGNSHEIPAETELGDALSIVAYGDASHISAFAYPNLTQYRGWLYFTDYFAD